MAQFTPFKLSKVLKQAVVKAMGDYDYLWHMRIHSIEVGVTDRGFDVWLSIDFDVQYNAQPIVKEN